MFEKSVFENLKATRNRAFDALNFACKEKRRSGRELSKKREELNAAWAKVGSAREKQQQEWELISSLQAEVNREWEVFKNSKDSISQDIDYAKSQQQRYHEESQQLFEKASEAYNYGDKSMAPYYSAQAKDARENRNYWQGEIRALIERSKNLQPPSDKVNRTAFNNARDDFRNAKKRHKKIQEEFNELKEIHQNNLQNFEFCKDELSKAKKAVDDYRIAGQKESERIKAENQARWGELEQIAKEAEMRHSENGRRIQYTEGNFKIKVKSGYDRRHHYVVTGILVIDNKSDNGLRLHLLIDKNGRELHRHIKGS